MSMFDQTGVGGNSGADKAMALQSTSGSGRENGSLMLLRPHTTPCDPVPLTGGT